MLTYDDNIFRLPAPNIPGVAHAPPGSSNSDEFNTAGVGMTGNWIFGLQSVLAKINGAENTFVKNTVLNNTSGMAKLEWDWTLTTVLNGQVGVDYARYLANFADSDFYGRDMIDDVDYYAGGIWDLGPHWRVKLNVRGESATHTATVREADDYENLSGAIGTEYALSPFDDIGLEYKYVHTNFRQGENIDGVFSNRNYDDDTIVFYFKHVLTGASTLEAGVGYIDHSYTSGVNGPGTGTNFSGDIWHVTVNYQPDVQIGLRFKAWRDLRTYVDAESDYFVSRDLSIGPVWSPLERLTVSLDASREWQSFVGENLVIGSLPQRRAVLTTAKAKIEYKLRRRLEIDAGYNYEKRVSDEADESYKDNLAYISVRYSF
jgi:hypothetical protein